MNTPAKWDCILKLPALPRTNGCVCWKFQDTIPLSRGVHPVLDLDGPRCLQTMLGATPVRAAAFSRVWTKRAGDPAGCGGGLRWRADCWRGRYRHPGKSGVIAVG